MNKLPNFRTWVRNLLTYIAPILHTIYIFNLLSVGDDIIVYE